MYVEYQPRETDWRKAMEKIGVSVDDSIETAKDLSDDQDGSHIEFSWKGQYSKWFSNFVVEDVGSRLYLGEIP